MCIIIGLIGSSGLVTTCIRIVTQIPNHFSNKCARHLAQSFSAILWTITFTNFEVPDICTLKLRVMTWDLSHDVHKVSRIL
ncbi:unnamed protein product [Adineta ricciae]|uniref:Uncharacterized protein n=1 Tax=Adineta ricciae TaxID=249248 RepID=A0A815XQ43_ADIRI|nr:unnamed protein product [Adineta ricciae]